SPIKLHYFASISPSPSPSPGSPRRMPRLLSYSSLLQRRRTYRRRPPVLFKSSAAPEGCSELAETLHSMGVPTASRDGHPRRSSGIVECQIGEDAHPAAGSLLAVATLTP